MWHKAEWMGRPMRLELTRVGLLVKLANRYTARHTYICIYFITISKKMKDKKIVMSFFLLFLLASEMYQVWIEVV